MASSSEQKHWNGQKQGTESGNKSFTSSSVNIRLLNFNLYLNTQTEIVAQHQILVNRIVKSTAIFHEKFYKCKEVVEKRGRRLRVTYNLMEKKTSTWANSSASLAHHTRWTVVILKHAPPKEPNNFRFIAVDLTILAWMLSLAASLLYQIVSSLTIFFFYQLLYFSPNIFQVFLFFAVCFQV